MASIMHSNSVCGQKTRSSTGTRQQIIGVLRPTRALRRQLQPRAVLSTIPNAPERSSSPGSGGSGGKLKTFGLLAAYVDVQAQAQRFEVFAGRSAMIGFIVALTAELLTERSIFNSVNPSDAALYSGAILAAMLTAAAAAAVSRQQLGLDFKEAVITSLTAAQRSAASVTGKQVDRAVDNVLKNVFDMGVIYSLLADDDIL